MKKITKCVVTHSQVDSGTCPWCGALVAEGPFRGRLPARQIGLRAWNMRRMLGDLDSEETSVRKITIENVRMHMEDIDSALVLYRKVLDEDVGLFQLSASVSLVDKGREFRKNNPTVSGFGLDKKNSMVDKASSLFLLGYHSCGPRCDTKARSEIINNIIMRWPESRISETPYMIPTDESGIREARALWIEQARKFPNNLAVLRNASHLLSLCDRKSCEDVLCRAKAIDPETPEWYIRLARLFRQQVGHELHVVHSDRTPEAYGELQLALELTTEGEERAQILIELAELALNAGDLDMSHSHAAAILKTGVFSVNSFARVFYEYAGHMIMGRVALARGDIFAAKEHLLNSMQRVIQNPIQGHFLGIFGKPPRLALAKELMQHGETDAVIHFFKLCSIIWESESERFSHLIAELKIGMIQGIE